jgi:hypothetical protein
MGTCLGYIDQTSTPEALLANWKYIIDREDYANVVDGAQSNNLIEPAMKKQMAREAKK